MIRTRSHTAEKLIRFGEILTRAAASRRTWTTRLYEITMIASSLKIMSGD